MEITQQLESVFCTKKINDLEDSEPFVLNRFLSFHPPALNTANKLNRFMFRNNKKLIFGLMMVATPTLHRTPFIQYVKKKDETEHEMWFLLEKVKQYHSWSMRELKMQLPLLLKIFEDKEILREYFVFFGIEKKRYKEYSLEFSMQKKNDLNRWF